MNPESKANETTTSKNTQISCVICGDNKVGKTQIYNLFMGEKFIEEHTVNKNVHFGHLELIEENQTTAVTSLRKSTEATPKETQEETPKAALKITEELKVLAEIKLHGIPTLAKSYVNNANIIFLVFDLTNKNSFNELKEYIGIINKQKKNEDKLLVLIGAKADLTDEIKVTDSEIIKFVEENAIGNDFIFECSAKNNTYRKLEIIEQQQTKSINRLTDNDNLQGIAIASCKEHLKKLDQEQRIIQDITEERRHKLLRNPYFKLLNRYVLTPLIASLASLGFILLFQGMDFIDININHMVIATVLPAGLLIVGQFLYRFLFALFDPQNTTGVLHPKEKQEDIAKLIVSGIVVAISVALTAIFAGLTFGAKKVALFADATGVFSAALQDNLLYTAFLGIGTVITLAVISCIVNYAVNKLHGKHKHHSHEKDNMDIPHTERFNNISRIFRTDNAYNALGVALCGALSPKEKHKNKIK